MTPKSREYQETVRRTTLQIYLGSIITTDDIDNIIREQERQERVRRERLCRRFIDPCLTIYSHRRRCYI